MDQSVADYHYFLYSNIKKFKICKDNFVSVNLHPHRCLYFYVCIKKISPSVKIGETYFYVATRFAITFTWNVCVIRRQ